MSRLSARACAALLSAALLLCACEQKGGPEPAIEKEPELSELDLESEQQSGDDFCDVSEADREAVPEPEDLTVDALYSMPLGVFKAFLESYYGDFRKAFSISEDYAMDAYDWENVRDIVSLSLFGTKKSSSLRVPFVEEPEAGLGNVATIRPNELLNELGVSASDFESIPEDDLLGMGEALLKADREEFEEFLGSFLTEEEMAEVKGASEKNVVDLKNALGLLFLSVYEERTGESLVVEAEEAR